MIGPVAPRKASAELYLPPLRPELELLPGSANAHGQPTWLIHDPLSNRFIQIEPAAREALKHWHTCSTAAELIERVNADAGTTIDMAGVVGLVDFFHASQLTVEPRHGGWQSLVRSMAARKHSLPAWLVHNYLFFRIPLIQPQWILERSLPVVRLLWSRFALAIIAMMGTIGLYLASRQWENFVGTLLSYFNWEGVVASATALAFVKLAHELGHAYAAVAFGCRVHTMGIAFLVMAPMPYTDVTDAWRLTDRRKRLMIDSAGMLTEAAIAAGALFVWAIVADGSVRHGAFVLSAVSIISSLAINLNPFMRFDGYYLMSEFLGIENLQSRAFAIGRWRLREFLFDLQHPCPEKVPANRIRVLIVYAWSVWIYRLIVFFGIALLVYHYFFKVLGIVLFGVEIVYFIARPIAGELLIWWKMKDVLFSKRRGALMASLAALALLGFLAPWTSTVEVPAVLEFAQLQAVHPTRNALIQGIHIKHGDSLKAGDLIATLRSSDIEDEIARTRISLEITELQYGRRAADSTDKEGSLVLESTISALRGKLSGLEKEADELKIRAPFDGRIVDLNFDLHPGRWVSPREMIAVIAGGQLLVAKGYVTESDVGRIAPGARAKFIPEHPSRSRVDLRVERIATAGALQIEIPDLASVNTGRIAVTPDEHHRLVPSGAQYLVVLSSDGATTESDLAIRGVALIEGRTESLFIRSWRRAIGILVRESGA